MNILFLTMLHIDLSERGIYNDLIKEFLRHNHHVYVVSPLERREHLQTRVVSTQRFHSLCVRTLNLQKTSYFEKGLGQFLLEMQYDSAIKKHFGGVVFDLLLYTTPPITFTSVISKIKRRFPNIYTYLLLKDIFPQNALDLGILSLTGAKGILTCYYKAIEKKLYSLSDSIGCMSPANINYLLTKYNYIKASQVELAPNSIELSQYGFCDRIRVRKKYGLPLDKPIFIYGGNLGKPQGIPFVIECLDANSKRDDCHFVIIGTGTELPLIRSWYEDSHPQSVTVMDGLPKQEYDELVRSCDVGLIFLDYRFTIPNYPSRLLSYLENKMPVLCATDSITDVGYIAEENGFGFWCKSNSVEAFNAILDKMILADRIIMGEKGFDYLKNNYLVNKTYNAIMSHLINY